jgi:nitroreductase
VDVIEALRRRRMTRAFDGTELDEDVVVALCHEAARSPTAGHARGVDAVVACGRAGVARYLDAATDPAWRERADRYAGFAAAGAAVVVTCDPARYAARYADHDKASSGLGDVGQWPVPYWFTDAAFFTMSLLLLAEEAHIDGAFLGAFRHEEDVLGAIGAPEGTRLFGAVLLGRGSDVQRPSGSAARSGPTRSERVHRGRFAGG